jgi:hypothetical protein
MSKILIATPSYDGKVDVWYANSLTNTILFGLQNDIIFETLYMAYDSLVQRARNDLAAAAIEGGYDGILWIDSDMEWHPQWAVDAVLAGKDVLGLPVIKKSATEEQYNVKAKPNQLSVEDGLMKVDSVGTGFLYLSKDAITYLWDNSKKYVHGGVERRWIFEVKLQGGDIISEDTLMCQKLRKGGFNIFIDPSRTCNHVGVLKYQGDFMGFVGRILEAEENK